MLALRLFFGCRGCSRCNNPRSLSGLGVFWLGEDEHDVIVHQWRHELETNFAFSGLGSNDKAAHDGIEEEENQSEGGKWEGRGGGSN